MLTYIRELEMLCPFFTLLPRGLVFVLITVLGQGDSYAEREGRWWSPVRPDDLALWTSGKGTVTTS
jgi:hypothetical protein